MQKNDKKWIDTTITYINFTGMVIHPLGHVISNIAIYDDNNGKVLYRAGMPNKVRQIGFEFTVFRAKKMEKHISVKNAFVYQENKEYTLYLPSSLVNFTYVETKNVNNNNGMILVSDIYTIDVAEGGDENGKIILESIEVQYTDEYKQAEKLSLEMNNVLGYNQLTPYDVMKLLKAYNISKK